MIPLLIQNSPDPFVDLGAVPIVQSPAKEIDRHIPGGLGSRCLAQQPSNLPAVHTDGIQIPSLIPRLSQKDDRAAGVHILQLLCSLPGLYRSQDHRPGPVPDFPFYQLHLLRLVIGSIKCDKADIPMELGCGLVHTLFEIHIIVVVVPLYDDGNRIYLDFLFLDNQIRGGHQKQQDQDAGPYAPEYFSFI